MTTKRRKNNFIDNKEMYAAFVKFHADCETAKEAGEPRPIEIGRAHV